MKHGKSVAMSKTVGSAGGHNSPEISQPSSSLVEFPLGRTWQPDVLKRLPWTGLLALLGALCCVAVARLILLF